MTLTVSSLIGSHWTYRRSDNPAAARRLSLLRRGQVGIYKNPNGASWDIREGVLCFFNRDGALTMEFAESEPNETGFNLKGGLIADPTVVVALERVTGGEHRSLMNGPTAESQIDAPREITDVVSRFESLGGGTVTPAGISYGCEFGLFQRRAGFESIGLLRWASIAPEGLIRGLKNRFSDLDDLTQLTMRKDGPTAWNAFQKSYWMYMAHTGLPYDAFSAEAAQKKLLQHLQFLRRKLIEDLTEGQKIFVYRTRDGSISEKLLGQLAEAVHSCGRSTLLYVKLRDQTSPPTTVERHSDALLFGYVDHFAVVNDPGAHNDTEWESVCRSALALMGQSQP